MAVSKSNKQKTKVKPKPKTTQKIDRKTSDFQDVSLPDINNIFDGDDDLLAVPVLEEPEIIQPEKEPEQKIVVKSEKIEKFKPNSDKPELECLPFRIGAELKNKLYQLCIQVYFKNELYGNKQTIHYILHTVLRNMQAEYINKYAELLTPNEFYLNFYSKRHTKGMPLPLNIPVEKNAVTTSTMISKEDKNLLYQLMHTFFKREVENVYGGVRYGLSVYMHEIVNFLEINIDNLEFID